MLSNDPDCVNRLPMQPFFLNAESWNAIVQTDTQAFRFGSFAHGWAEWLHGFILVSAPEAQAQEFARLAAAHAQKLGHPPQGIYLRHLVTRPGANSAPIKFLGQNVQVPLPVRECGLTFHLDLTRGYSYGLFTDQRSNRMFLRRLRPKRLLNLFAYTCAFSVAAAVEGAHCTSVDISAKALDWGRTHFTLNEISPADHLWYRQDALKMLPRLARQGRTFDAIILDPPTFSRNREGRVFRLENDLPQLIYDAWRCLEPGGFMLISTNKHGWDRSHLQAAFHARIPGPMQHFVLPSPPPPPDPVPGAGCSTTWWVAKPKPSH